MLFDKLSPTADFISKIQLQLDIVNKNVLYITHMQDKILKIVNSLENSQNLQKQVDQYFDDDARDIPEDEQETK